MYTKERMPIEVLRPAPRQVPLKLRLRVLFGGFMTQFGLLFFAFGSIFCWIFLPAADFTSWIAFSGTVQEVNGVVSHSEETNFSSGGSDSSGGTPIYANHYEYEADGVRFHGVSYAVGKDLPPNQTVTVEYTPSKPEISRIKHMRRKPVPPFVIFVLLFPIVGGVMATFGIRQNVKGADLLSMGVITYGKVIKKQKTGAEINNRTVYKLTFEFKDHHDQAFQATFNTHEPERVENENLERVLYDPASPTKAVLLDGLPGDIKINAKGLFDSKDTKSVAVILALPILAVATQVAFIYFKWFN